MRQGKYVKKRMYQNIKESVIIKDGNIKEIIVLIRETGACIYDLLTAPFPESK